MFQSSPPPEAIVDSNGQLTYGVFNAPFSRINLADADLKHRGLRLTRGLVGFRLKEWQHFCLLLPDLMASFAIVDSKFLKVSWCHVVQGDTHFEHARQSPVLDVKIARELWNDRTHVHARGYRLDVANQLDTGHHQVSIRIDGARGKPAISADLRCEHDLEQIQPLVVVLPVGPNRGMYSHKVALPIEGSIQVGDRRYEATPDRCFAILDIHKAHYPRHTWWNWATCAGHDDQGRPVALNLTRNVVLDDQLNENALWVDGKLHHLGAARFDFDKDDVLAPWRLGTADGEVDVTFTPRGERAESIRLGLVKSVFHQPYGTFSGTVKVGDQTARFSDLWGVCEDHDARW
jgi:hypothetical protein